MDYSTLSNDELLAMGRPKPAKSFADVTDAELLAAGKAGTSEIANTAKDVGKSIVSGATRVPGGILGLPGTLNDLIDAGGNYIDRKLGTAKDSAFRFGRDAQPPGALHPATINAQVQKGADAIGIPGPEYKPQTTLGEYGKTGGEFLAGAMFPGGAVQRAVNVIAPAAASETAGQLTKGTAAEPWARVAGALVAPSVATRAITPAPASVARTRMVQDLEREGVTSITAGQATGRRPLRYAESVLGDTPFAGAGATRIQEEGQRQFTGAVMGRAGRPGELASPEVLRTNQARLGNEFETLAARNTMNVDTQFARDILDVSRNYARVLPSEQRAQVANIITDITNQGPTIPGRMYQDTRSRLSRQANSVRESDPAFSQALRGIRNALDDAMARSMSPADQQALATARREYGAQKTIEKSASRAGEVTGEGNVTPANLRNTVSAENRGRYARGEGDFSDLARAGATVMAPLPNSGTPARLAAMNMLALPGAMLGAVGGPAGAGIGHAIGMAAIPPITGRILMSALVQRYLRNQQLAGPARGDPRRAAILDALMASEHGP